MGKIRDRLPVLRDVLFVFLLPVFFVVHNFYENAFVLPIKEAFSVGTLYVGVTVVFLFLFWPLYKDLPKASIVVFCLMAFNFFFGSLHDFSRQYIPQSVFVKYVFILPATVLFFTILIIYLKRTKKTFKRAAKYLTLVLITLTLLDLALISLKLPQKKEYVDDRSLNLTICDSCYRPDIYMIIFDEYAGRQELLDIFSFDNSLFESELKKRKFHLLHNSFSNYNFTVHSMASMLNMTYLKNMKYSLNLEEMFICRDLIQNNTLSVYLKESGYQIYNYTFFNFDEQPRAIANPNFQSKRTLFTSQTFIRRARYDIGFHFASSQKIAQIQRKHLLNNKDIFQRTKKIAETRTRRPKFVYTHFAMPHHPYYFDSLGRETGYERMPDKYKSNKDAYIQYLVHTNKKILELIDHIKKTSSKPPVILLMSDHGFRQFETAVDKKYHFMNLNAIYLPDGNYQRFYDGISNVNQFRILLNTVFKQQLPLLKDSAIYIKQ